MDLTSKQRAQLRGLANGIDTILQIGKDGIGENLVKQADGALEARELIKGKVLENNLEYDARTAAEELAKATRSEVVQVIGTKFVLYRETHSKPKEKRIQLVKERKKKPRSGSGGGFHFEDRRIRRGLQPAASGTYYRRPGGIRAFETG